MREFLHVDDLAQVVLFAIEKLSEHIYNVGTGKDLSILKLAELIKLKVGYAGTIRWDKSKPNEPRVNLWIIVEFSDMVGVLKYH